MTVRQAIVGIPIPILRPERGGPIPDRHSTRAQVVEMRVRDCVRVRAVREGQRVAPQMTEGAIAEADVVRAPEAQRCRSGLEMLGDGAVAARAFSRCWAGQAVCGGSSRDTYIIAMVQQWRVFSVHQPKKTGVDAGGNGGDWGAGRTHSRSGHLQTRGWSTVASMSHARRRDCYG